MAELNDILTEFISNEIAKYQIYTKVATVKSVDENNMTAEVSFINEDSDKTVRLGSLISADNSAANSSNLIVLPSVDSFVLVTFINDTTGFISAFSTIDKIQLKVGDRFIKLFDGFIDMGGDSNFMVRFNELETGFNDLKDDLNSMIQNWNAFANVYVPGSPTTTGLPPTANAATASAADISGAKIDEIRTL